MRSLLQRLARSIPAVGAWARRAWCRRRRRLLVGVTTTVLGVPAHKVEWAPWGAERRLFDADWAGRLLHLRGR